MDSEYIVTKSMEHPLNLIEAINQLNELRARVARGLGSSSLKDVTFGMKFHDEIQVTMISLLKQIQTPET